MIDKEIEYFEIFNNLKNIVFHIDSLIIFQ